MQRKKECCTLMLCGMCHITIYPENHIGRHHMGTQRLPVCDECFERYRVVVHGKIEELMRKEGGKHDV